jgi:simple sugar transport system ATP-binding protein
MSTAPLLEMRGIDKRFGEVHANRSVDLTLHAGEVLGLLGENGAGKTTLMNILFGLYTADAGSIRVDGRVVPMHSSADALGAGVGMVHQHFHLVPRHTVLENLMVGQPGRRGRLDEASARSRIADIVRHYGLELAADALVSDLSVGEQQRVEIVKALFRGARALILDEPTSVLTPQQSEGLFAALRAMVADGVGIIFISHKLQEVLAITDRLAVMRRGEMVATLDNDDSLDQRELAELMCGHELTPPTKPASRPGRVLLQLSAISVGGTSERPDPLKEVSLTLRGGEIVGVAGVSGNGQRELAEVIAGLQIPSRGHMEVDATPVERPTPRLMQRLGIASIPEDRIGAGLLTSLPLSDSMILARFRQSPFSRWGWLIRSRIRRFVTEQMQRFDIRAAGPDVRTGTLSGGNLQKALLARELAFEPLMLVAAQPTRGLDVAARDFVHQRFLELRGRGRAVLIISEDLEELFTVADRIVVMFDGSIVGDVPVDEASTAGIGLLMVGARQAA